MTDLLIPDDSGADGTDLAHPAYWRGEKAGVVGVAMRWEDALTEPMPKPGVLGHPKLESLYRRTEALRKERDALEAAVKGMAKALRDEQARADAAEKERDEIQGVFDRGWAANMRGIKAWQAAHPGHDNVWPDKAKFTEWMLTRMTALTDALQREIARCPLCHGKGEWETDCPYCGDSTWDHACITETKKCDRCVAASAALAGNGNGTGGPTITVPDKDALREFMREHGERMKRGEDSEPLPAAPPSAGETR